MSKKRMHIRQLSAREDWNKQMQGRVLPWNLQASSRMRADIATWKAAENSALAKEPKMYPLMQLLEQCTSDALLSSQIQNRKQQLFTAAFSLVNSKGDADEEQTLKLKNSVLYRDITNAILDADNYGTRWWSCMAQKTS